MPATHPMSNHAHSYNSCFNNVKFFLVCISGFVLFQSILVSGITSSVITTIEKRFAFKSVESGLIVSSFDFGSLLVVIIVSYFGGQGNRPKWLGFGAIIVAIGAVVFSLPHFISPTYDIQHQSTSSNNSLTDAACVNDSSYLPSVHCESSVNSSLYIFVFILANMIVGIGSTPIYTLGNTYLYDNVDKTHASMYIAIMYVMGAVGPALGYVMGGLILKIYVEIGVEGPPEGDGQYVGAWWVGYLISGSFVLFVAFPLFGFPAQMKKNISNPSIYADSEESDDIMGTTMGFGEKLKDLPKAFASLLCNPTFLFITASATLEFSNITAFLTFIPKYLQSQFGIPASTAGIYTGTILIPSAGSGIILGGYLVKRLNLKITGCAKLGIISISLSLIMYICFFIIACDIPQIIGLQVAPGSNIAGESLSACGTECMCAVTTYDPMCFDSSTYYNPCVAGCQHSLPPNVTQVLASELNCTCLDADDVIHAGACESDCQYAFIPFMTCLFITTLITATAQTPGLLVTMRSVKNNERPFAMGLQFVFFRTLAYIPAPMYFGYAIDNACMLWDESKGCQNEGHCMIYNTYEFRVYYFGLSFSLKLASLIFIVLTWLFARREYRRAKLQRVEQNSHSDCSASENAMQELNVDTPSSSRLSSSIHFHVDKTCNHRNSSESEISLSTNSKQMLLSNNST